MKRIKYLLLILILMFIYIPTVSATRAVIASVGGNIYVGEEKEFEVLLTNANGSIRDFNIKYGVNDSSCITITGVTPVYKSVQVTNSNAYYLSDGTPIPNNSTLFKIKIKGLKNCRSELVFTSLDLSDDNGDIVTCTGSTPAINVLDPPSSNNNLNSLSVSVGNLSPSFNSNNTNYNVSVDNNISSINISATPSDSKATISGLGNKNLNYGNNKIDITVKAENGSTKTYTINVNRKDNRSSNNNLKSLSTKDGTLSPEFNKDKLNYKISVPYSVDKLNLNYVAEDSKANVVVSGNNNFVAEETQNVYVKVTAENGSTKTYTISVTRGKDPNKKLSKDNYLLDIKPSIGILSPVFNKETTDYVIYLPYEVENISFETILSDTRYGKLEKDELDILSPGVANKFTYKVTSEDNSTRTYSVVVKRAINPKLETSSNTYLKSINVSNGKLLFTNGKKVTDFNKEIKKYYYKKRTGFKVKAEAEDKNSNVVEVKDGSTINFIVEAPNGDFSIYTMELYGSYHIYTYIVIFLLGVTSGIVFMITKNILIAKGIKISIKVPKKKNK